jgi:hypothetical protein
VDVHTFKERLDMTEPAYKGLLLVDCIGLTDGNPMQPVRALQNIAGERGLKVIVLTDLKPEEVEAVLRRNKISEEGRPVIERLPFHSHIDTAFRRLGKQPDVDPDRAIYFTNRRPDSEVSLLEEARSTGACVLSYAGFDRKTGLLCSFFFGADCGERPHSPAMPASTAIQMITSAWEPEMRSDRKRALQMVRHAALQ